MREAVLASRDQSAALGMMLQASTVPDPTVLLEHAQLVLDGRVKPLLLWEKHPVAIGAVGFIALLLLLIVKRLMFPLAARLEPRAVAAPIVGIVPAPEAEEPRRGAVVGTLPPGGLAPELRLRLTRDEHKRQNKEPQAPHRPAPYLSNAFATVPIPASTGSNMAGVCNTLP